jgi:transcriptional regulator with XRE-family HTH domain
VRLGEFLRNERQRKGISLETAAEETRIKDVYLRALEEEDYDLIPGEIYQRHYFKTYLEYLGHDDLYFRLTRERPKAAQMSDRMVREPTEDVWDTARYVRVIWRGVLLLVFLAVVVWLIVWGVGRLRRPAATGPAVKPNEELVIDILPDAATLSDDMNKKIAGAVGPSADLGDIHSQIAGALDEHTMRIDTEDETWVRVSGPEGVLFQGLMKKGDSKEFGPLRFFLVTLGKPENAWIYLDSKHIYGGKLPSPSSQNFYLPADYKASQAETDKLLGPSDKGAASGGTN